MGTFGIDHLISQLIQAGIEGAIQRRTAAYRPEIDEEAIELRPVNFIAWLGGAYLVMGTGFLVGASVEHPSTFAWIMMVSGPVCMAIGVWMIRFRVRHRVYLNTEKFYVRPVFGKIRMYAFSGILSCDKARNKKDLRIRMKTGGKVTLSHYLIGLNALHATISHHLLADQEHRRT